MQTAWSRSLRPQSSCRCISCINQLPGVLSRRTTTTGIARKRLTARDAFALLLTPVFGGALIVDERAKDKRRKEWDERIAAAKAEVEQIRGSGSGIKPYTIRSRNLRRLPALSRNYSHAAAFNPLPADEYEEDPIETLKWPSPTESHHCDQKSASTPPVPFHGLGPIDQAVESQKPSTLNQTTLETCKRIQRLVAIKLAIRMLLHVHIGKSPRFIKTSSDYLHFDDDRGHLPGNANELILHLKQVNNTLRKLSSEKLQSSWAAYQSLTRGESCSLDNDLCDLARQFRRGDLNVAQLVERFAESLLSSSESPTVHGYVPLLKVLSRARFEELSFLIDGTMIEARLPYDQHAVFTLLWQYGKNKEAGYFDRLIKKLTADGANARFGEQWLWKNIDGTVVPIPPSQDPQILQILIYAALKCNQPHRAEAWSKLLSWTRNGHLWRSHVMRNFLKYYSAHRNWSQGKVWLKSALNQAEMLAGQGIRHLQRVVFSMLDFCVAYGERALYRDIMKAAGECRLGVYSADPDITLTQRTADILREWTFCHGGGYNGGIDALAPVEKARLFSRKLRHIHKGERDEVANSFTSKRHLTFEDQPATGSGSESCAGGLSDLERLAPMGFGEHSEPVAVFRENAEAVKWKDLCRQQQMQLDSLKRQLQYFKTLQNPESATGEVQVNNLPADAEEPLQIASRKETVVPHRPFEAASNPTVALDQRSFNQSSTLALDAAVTRSDMEQLRRSELAPSMEETAPPLRHVASTPGSSTNSHPPFFRPLMDPSPPTADQRALGARLIQNPESHNIDPKLVSPNNLQTIFKDEDNLPPPATPLANPFRCIPTISELEDALTFCTYILNSLSAHIKAPRPIRPLYMLVSTVPRNLLVTIIIDCRFSHFIRQMLTKWEHDSFWDKLMLEIRERQEHRSLSAPAEKEEARAEEKAEAEVEVEEEAGAELPITREIHFPKQVIRHINSAQGLPPASKQPYRSLQPHLRSRSTSAALPLSPETKPATPPETQNRKATADKDRRATREEELGPLRPFTRQTFPTTDPAHRITGSKKPMESREPAFRAPYRSLRLEFLVEESGDTGGAVG